jgi:hypothetical protein
MLRSYSLIKLALVGVGGGVRLAAALTRTPFLTTSAQEGALVEEQGFVGRTECEGCFPVHLATPPSTPELQEMERQEEGQTANTQQACIVHHRPQGRGGKGWGVEGMGDHRTATLRPPTPLVRGGGDAGSEVVARGEGLLTAGGDLLP